MMSTSDNLEILHSHIEAGVRLLQLGNGLEAYEHFESSDAVQGLGRVSIGPGMIFSIERLLEDADVVRAASEVARHSRTSGYTAEIGGWHNGTHKDMFSLSDTKRYNPGLVEAFHQEAGIVAAEEWLHVLQNVTGRPLAGEDNKEVDVAAYFAGRDIKLSVDFLTRYPERAEWYLADHPDYHERFQRFCRTFSRQALS